MCVARYCFYLVLAVSLHSAQAGMVERIGPDGVTYFSPEQQQPQVTMYGVPGCGYCRQARAYFAGQGIEYVEYNINKSEKRYKRVQAIWRSGDTPDQD